MTALCMRSKQSNGYDDAFMAHCADELCVTPEDIVQNTFLAAESGGRLMGCACLTVLANGSMGEIESFFVDPKAKRQGVGRQLWRAILQAAQTQGVTQLELSADPEAEPFYRTLGFTTVGRTPSGSIPGRSLPQMRYVVDTVT